MYKALVFNIDKCSKDEAPEDDGDIIIVRPQNAEFSAWEIAEFDICGIDEDCFSELQRQRLDEGRSVVYPFSDGDYPISCVRASAEAVKGGIVSKSDLIRKQ